MAKKTAIEWLVEQIKSKTDNLPTNTKENRRLKGAYVDCLMMLKKAKEMLEQQIIDAYNQGWNDRGNDDGDYKQFEDAEQYYNETFKAK